MIEQKESEYNEYISNHVKNVQRVWKRVQPLMTGENWLDDYSWSNINDLILCHDESKNNSIEFHGYRQFFLALDGEKNQDIFNQAWNQHQKTNPHHWQYWIMWKPEGSIALDMSWEYIIEMLCDWAGMSLQFGDKPSLFYDKEKDKMLLSDMTRECVERLLPVFDKAIT